MVEDANARTNGTSLVGLRWDLVHNSDVDVRRNRPAPLKADGKLQITISTAGTSPSLAQRLREEMELSSGPEYDRGLADLPQEPRMF